jgi:4-hydroxy-tetrahydrodipicolinate reductase
LKALLVGYGKMGRAIEEVLIARGHVVAGCIVRGEIFLEGELPGGSGGRRAPDADIVFEFTIPSAAERNVLHYLSKKSPVVSGTTGWDIAGAERLAREKSVPFLYSANFSLGVAALRRGVQAVAAALAPFPEFEAGIVERHHSKKKDAPSGTAKLLASDVGSARSVSGVPIASLRQGGVPGEHVVFFEGEHETVELLHRARSRAIFALGAVRAAEWILASGRSGPLTFEEFFEDASRGGNVP